MRGRTNSAAHTRAISKVQEGLRQVTRGLQLLTKEILKEVKSTARGGRRTPSPGRRLHGRYIGLIRNLPVRAKAKVRAVRAKKGVEAAIKMAEELRRSQ
jgi:hypothetical protein